MRTTSSLPLPVKRALTKLGEDIKAARIRRRISTPVMAERLSISRMTLLKLEHGDPGVSIGTYATALFVLGLISRLSDLTDVRHDDIGLQLDEERLPKRIRKSARKSVS
jgi:transcriptional regulator with XRE-family HTH domain